MKLVFHDDGRWEFNGMGPETEELTCHDCGRTITVPREAVWMLSIGGAPRCPVCHAAWHRKWMEEAKRWEEDIRSKEVISINLTPDEYLELFQVFGALARHLTELGMEIDRTRKHRLNRIMWTKDNLRLVAKSLGHDFPKVASYERLRYTEEEYDGAWNWYGEPNDVERELMDAITQDLKEDGKEQASEGLEDRG
jgi:hypothetical protein